MRLKKPSLKKEIKIKQEEWFNPEGELVIDVFQTSKTITIQAPIAGVKNEDIEILLENDTLKIKGDRKKPKRGKEETYLLQECYWGAFSREIILPVEVNKAKIDAEIKHGILTISIPKKNTETKSKKIIIKGS